VEINSAHHWFPGYLGLGNLIDYALSDQYLQPYYAEHLASVLRQTLEEQRCVCDTEFVTEPSTPFR
jgi:hypothetical protein